MRVAAAIGLGGAYGQHVDVLKWFELNKNI